MLSPTSSAWYSLTSCGGVTSYERYARTRGWQYALGKAVKNSDISGFWGLCLPIDCLRSTIIILRPPAQSCFSPLYHIPHHNAFQQLQPSDSVTRNRIKKAKSPLRIPLPLQPSQLLEPPGLIPIYLLQCLIPIGVIRISIQSHR